jgi:hypothetical protein
MVTNNTEQRLNIRRLITQIALSAISLVLAQGLVLADGRISLRLTGGGTYISGGDVNPGTQDWFYYNISHGPNEDFWTYWHGGHRAVHNGYELGGDVIYALTPRIGISMGGGYLRISRASSMSFGFLNPSLWAGGAGANPKLSAVPIRVGMHLTMPLSRKVNFLAEGGVCYYFNARYSDELGAVTGDMGVTSSTRITTSAEAKGVPLGLHGGLGFEYRLLPNLFLSLSALGRYARFRTWEGSSEFEIFDYMEGTTTFFEQGILYYELVPDLPDPPRLIAVQSSPSMTIGPEPRQAAIDFSGVSLQFGIRIRL